MNVSIVSIGRKIILTISLCLNFFLAIVFWLLIIAYKATIDSHKEIDNELDELLKDMKEKINEK